MGRPSNRAERRTQILRAFERVLAEHGYAGATIAAVALEAGLAPGLLHHHFESKDELLGALLEDLIGRFRRNARRAEARAASALTAYGDAALRLDERADVTAARCWVGLFAEAVRNPALFKRMRRVIDAEIGAIEARSRGALSTRDASAVLAFIVGALVLGAFAPQKTAGFAAPALQTLITALRS